MKLNSQRGNTLLQALVAVAITAIVAINMISVFSTMSRSNNLINVYQEVQTTVDQVRLILANTNLCTLNFQGKDLTTTGTFPIEQTGTDWTGANFKIRPPGAGGVLQTAAGTEIAGNDKPLQNGARISEMKLVLTGNVGNTFYGMIKMTFQATAGTVAGPTSFNRELPLRIEKDAGNNVVSCGAQPELTMSCTTKQKTFGLNQQLLGKPLDNSPGGRKIECDSPTAEITSCQTLESPQGSLVCGTWIHPRVGSTPTFCDAGSCNAPTSGQSWYTQITCCETGGPVAPPPPAPNLSCETQTSGWQTGLVPGNNLTASCSAGFSGVTCMLDFYDNNGSGVYHGAAPAVWNVGRTTCSTVISDAGMTEAAVTATCCRNN